MFEVRSTRWHLLTTLPKGLLLTRPSAAICRNQLYVIGLEGFGCSCSLQALPAIDKPIKPQPILHIISWVPLPRLPVGNSTATTLTGKLVIVGGSEDWSQLNSIHQLVDGQWVQIGSMSSRRWLSLVVCPSPTKMMIVGGVGLSSVEECIVV